MIINPATFVIICALCGCAGWLLRRALHVSEWLDGFREGIKHRHD